MQRNGQKRYGKNRGENDRKKDFFSTAMAIVFLTWTFPNIFYGVFELLLLRNAQTHHTQKRQN
jgi:hypothetical protein